MDVLPMMAYMKKGGMPVNILSMFCLNRYTGMPMQKQEKATRKYAIILSTECLALVFNNC